MQWLAKGSDCHDFVPRIKIRGHPDPSGKINSSYDVLIQIGVNTDKTFSNLCNK